MVLVPGPVSRPIKAGWTPPHARIARNRLKLRATSAPKASGNKTGEILKTSICSVALAAATIALATPATAQTASAGAAQTAEPVASDARCELHVWPTENYLGLNTGLLSGFGLLGGLVDAAAHEGRVKTVKELMADYLGPDAQMQELDKIGIAKTLKLSGYKIVVEPATPFNEDVKKDPELKAKVKALNARLKAGQRLSDSKHPCYAELVTTYIFYHKAMMYGSNLFTGWVYRQFGDKPLATRTAAGAVKNPLEVFPPKTADNVDAAKAELRDAFAKDFVEYVDKKVMRTAGGTAAAGN
jgi:hypothetical protein